MSAWISVYCTHSLAQVTPAALDAALAQADFWTLAEIYAIDEAQVIPALACLRIESENPTEFQHYNVIYREPKYRPVCITRCAGAAVVAQLAELHATLMAQGMGANAEIIRHLEQVIEIVNIELGYTQLADMGLLIAYEIARFLAMLGNGLVQDAAGSWWRIGQQGEFVQFEWPD